MIAKLIVMPYEDNCAASAAPLQLYLFAAWDRN